MNKNITFTEIHSYDNRIMKKFSNVLKTNEIEHRFYKKENTLVIDHGFKTVFRVVEPGYWNACRLDKSIEMSRLNFSFPVNSHKELILKCIRFKLVPYSVMKRLKL